MGTLSLLYDKPYHMWRKDTAPFVALNNMWRAGNMGLHDETKLETVYGVTNSYYYVLVILSVGALIMKLRRPDLLTLLCAAMLFGIFVVHLILEASERYHYFGVILFLLLIAGAVNDWKPRTRRHLS